MKKAISGFTLVELIIVITILSILSTIGFISYASFTKDARNSKRKTNVSQIDTAFNVGIIKGVNPILFAANNSNTLSGDFIGPDYQGPSFNGFTGSNLPANKYQAGDIDPNTLGINKSIIVDPLTQTSYKIGVVTIGTIRYQIAATLEGNVPEVYLIGNYKKRIGISGVAGTLLANSTEITNINSADGLKFMIGDKTWIGNGTDKLTISKISVDGTKITLSGPNPWGDQSYFGLTTDETNGLISKYSSKLWPTYVGDKYDDNIPYKIN